MCTQNVVSGGFLHLFDSNNFAKHLFFQETKFLANDQHTQREKIVNECQVVKN